MKPKYIFPSIILACSLFDQEEKTSQMIEIETKDENIFLGELIIKINEFYGVYREAKIFY